MRLKKSLEYAERFEIMMFILHIDARQMSVDLGFARSTIYALASGKPKMPSERFLNALAMKYGVSGMWLLHGVGPMFLPGKSQLSHIMEDWAPDDLEIKMARYLLACFSLPRTFLGKAIEMSGELLSLSKEDHGDTGGPYKESSERVTHSLIRLHRKYANRKADWLMERKGVEAKVLTKMKGTPVLRSDLSKHVLSKHKDILSVWKADLLDAVFVGCHKQGRRKGVYHLEALCQFSFMGRIDKGGGMVDKEFNIVIDVSFYVLEEIARFQVIRVLREDRRFGEHEIFYASDAASKP